ncbi:alpha/beta hydrolase [Streptomyces sp. enrichment culture]|uniref:alpha/beta hydrolase n=1 Tax=Streptomyces sp. enrichment culture TaxID=1795815 RepID=UPI003F55FF85
MTRTPLWPDELEPLRPEARHVADSALPMFAELMGSPDLAPAERFRIQRQRYDEIRRPLGNDPRELEVRDIVGRSCRVFVPSGTPRGVYLQIHGGGWSLGSPADGDVENLRRCRELGLVVVAASYRLAPEHRYPAATDDVFGVAQWLLENAADEWGGGDRLALGGGSAGAHLAAITALRIRDELGAIGRIAGLNLVVGLFDLSGTPSQSGLRVSDGGDVLDPALIELQVSNFVGEAMLSERRDPRISPMYADLRGLPHTLLSAGYDDHLLDDSLFFAQRLTAAGTDVDLRVYPECNHSFTGLPTAMAARAQAVVDGFLAGCFGAER